MSRKIVIERPYRCLQPREIEVNRLNFWVGGNGTGKSSLIQLLVARLSKANPKLKKQFHWMGVADSHDAEAVQLEGFDSINEILMFSDKVAQTRNLDMDAVFDMPGSVGLLRASEGQVSGAFLVNAAKNREREDVLFIFDEIDGHLDYATKRIFFNRVLPAIKGPTIVISHDSLFMAGQQVFDFNDWTAKSGEQYYSDACKRV